MSILAADLFCGAGGTSTGVMRATQALRLPVKLLAINRLAAAHSFPRDYHFAGNREKKVRQIGNSVPVGLAEALCLEALRGLVR